MLRILSIFTGWRRGRVTEGTGSREFLPLPKFRVKGAPSSRKLGRDAPTKENEIVIAAEVVYVGVLYNLPVFISTDVSATLRAREERNLANALKFVLNVAQKSAINAKHIARLLLILIAI